MGIINTFLAWLAEKVLTYFLSQLKAEIVKKAEELKKDKERGTIDDKNVTAYEEAKSRADRVDAALGLLNRTP